MNPKERAELNRQVEELLAKGFVRHSPCAVPALLLALRDKSTHRNGANSHVLSSLL